jgi:hypothetical protein
MTKKHFIALANVLKTLRPVNVESDEYIMWRDCVRSIATVCGSTNPRFNRYTFYSACGLEN